MGQMHVWPDNISVPLVCVFEQHTEPQSSIGCDIGVCMGEFSISVSALYMNCWWAGGSPCYQLMNVLHIIYNMNTPFDQDSQRQ